MTATKFVDTNVLIYAASKSPDDAAKSRRAREILRQPDLAFSSQVLQEFYSAAVTKHRLGMSHSDAVAVLEALTEFPVCSITRTIVLDAIEARVRFQISYWDAAILMAARTLGCAVVYSEDLNAGQDYDGVRVINPFADLPMRLESKPR